MTPAPRVKVVCVDDEHNVLEGLKLHLERRFDVHTAAGGAEGLELLGDARLRARADDIAVLAKHFLELLNAGAPIAKRMSQDCLRQLQMQPWPGNVRELKNAISRAYILADRVLEAPTAAGSTAIRSPRRTLQGGALEFTAGTPLAEVEREMILTTLDRHTGNKRQAADALGISLKTLYNRLESYRAAG